MGDSDAMIKDWGENRPGEPLINLRRVIQHKSFVSMCTKRKSPTEKEGTSTELRNIKSLNFIRRIHL